MILICGASGILGKELCLYFDKNNIDYYGTYNSRKINKANMVKIDFSNIEEIRSFLLEKNISHVIFSIVERVTDVCENNWKAIKKVNIDMVNNTSYLCNELDIKFIHISTDYVFDGSKQPNYPSDQKNPLQNYGISKLISELKVETNCKKKNYCIVRTPVLYSKHSNLFDNAVTLIGKKVMDLRNLNSKEDDYCIRRPVYIPDLCVFLHDCCIKNYSGIYHFYNPNNKFTKYEMSKKIADILSVDTTQNIMPNKTKSVGLAPRPYDTQLKDDRYDNSSYNFTDFDDSLKECFIRFKYPIITHDFLQAINPKDYFFLIDMDGTIVNSARAHYNAYKKTLKLYDITICSYSNWCKIIESNTVNDYLLTLVLDSEKMIEVKNKKNVLIGEEEIELTKNSDFFIDFLNHNKINYCIVTNTSRKTVEHFKKKQPILASIENYICREDYEKSKPDSDPYNVAINKHYKDEKYIIGIEDSLAGIKSLEGVTDIRLVFNNPDVFKREDVYLFDDFKQII